MLLTRIVTNKSVSFQKIYLHQNDLKLAELSSTWSTARRCSEMLL